MIHRFQPLFSCSLRVALPGLRPNMTTYPCFENAVFLGVYRAPVIPLPLNITCAQTTLFHQTTKFLQLPPSSHLLLPAHSSYSVFLCSNGLIYPLTEILKHPWRFFRGRFCTFRMPFLLMVYRYPSKKQSLKVLHRIMDCLFLKPFLLYRQTGRRIGLTSHFNSSHSKS